MSQHMAIYCHNSFGISFHFSLHFLPWCDTDVMIGLCFRQYLPKGGLWNPFVWNYRLNQVLSNSLSLLHFLPLCVFPNFFPFPLPPTSTLISAQYQSLHHMHFSLCSFLLDIPFLVSLTTWSHLSLLSPSLFLCL